MLKQLLTIVALLIAVLESKATATQSSELEKFFHFLYNNQPAARSALDEAEESADTSISSRSIDGAAQLERADTYTGNYPAHTYPFADFASYAPNCEFSSNNVAHDVYTINDVPDIFSCGFQFCYGSSVCSHFYYKATGGICVLKSRPSSGTSWGTRSTDYHCGIIPSRACNTARDSVQNLLGCLALDI